MKRILFEVSEATELHPSTMTRALNGGGPLRIKYRRHSRRYDDRSPEGPFCSLMKEAEASISVMKGAEAPRG
jgi:hypothetical protein